MNELEKFEAECAEEIALQGRDAAFQELSRSWMDKANSLKYSYHFSVLGRPVIQYPQDLVAVQELIWTVKPDLILETGIAHGGSLILSASMLALIDYCGAVAAGTTLDPRAGRRKVIGLDIDIRPHNRAAIEAHPMAHKIEMIEGSSVDDDVVRRVHDAAAEYDRVLIFLDSNHTHDHVLAELEAYAPLTSKGSYCVVFDTVIEDLPDDTFRDRPWSRGNNAKTAVWRYLEILSGEGRTAADGDPLKLAVDEQLEQKLAVTVAPSGYLKRPA